MSYLPRRSSGCALGRWSWTWRKGTIDASDVGTPSDQTDLAACVYDADGVLVGGSILHGASEWVTRKTGLRYYDLSYARHGFRKVRIRFGTGSGGIVVKARGPLAAVPATQATLPFTAQLVNLDSGACWQSVFTTAKRNDPGRIRAKIP